MLSISCSISELCSTSTRTMTKSSSCLHPWNRMSGDEMLSWSVEIVSHASRL